MFLVHAPDVSHTHTHTRTLSLSLSLSLAEYGRIYTENPVGSNLRKKPPISPRLNKAVALFPRGLGCVWKGPLGLWVYAPFFCFQ
jgi:hypothetical protein